MPAYRLYFLGNDGRICRALELECVSDQQAISRANELAGQTPMELWERARRIKSYEAGRAHA